MLKGVSKTLRLPKKPTAPPVATWPPANAGGGAPTVPVAGGVVLSVSDPGSPPTPVDDEPIGLASTAIGAGVDGVGGAFATFGFLGFFGEGFCSTGCLTTTSGSTFCGGGGSLGGSVAWATRVPSVETREESSISSAVTRSRFPNAQSINVTVVKHALRTQNIAFFPPKPPTFCREVQRVRIMQFLQGNT